MCTGRESIVEAVRVLGYTQSHQWTDPRRKDLRSPVTKWQSKGHKLLQLQVVWHEKLRHLDCFMWLDTIWLILASSLKCTLSGFPIQYGQLPVFSSLFLLKLHPTCTARSSLRLETSKRSKVTHCWEDCWDMEVEMHPSSILVHMKPTSSRFPCLQNFFGFLLPRPPKDQTILAVSWGFADSEIAFTKHQTICTENEHWTTRLASIDVNKSPGSTSLEWSDMCDLF